MKSIQFKSKSAQRVYDDYINRCQKTIKILSKADKEDCLLEINSYIYEFLANTEAEDEMENLLNIIERLGPPEETLKEAIATKKTEQAIKTFNPKFLFQALILNISNGIIYIILFVLFLLLFCFPVLIVLKLIYPNEVGLYVGEGSFYVGFVDSPVRVTEISGNWFIPFALVISCSLYLIIILLLKLKTKLK
ncbi:MAG: hypothetical protein PSX36_04740 [bacterium]|nr:hypothetical protein [bacterium]